MRQSRSRAPLTAPVNLSEYAGRLFEYVRTKRIESMPVIVPYPSNVRNRLYTSFAIVCIWQERCGIIPNMNAWTSSNASRMLLLLATLAAADVHSESGGVFTDGAFYTGCNYWASHAGVYMWRDRNGEQVEKDMAVFEVECNEGGR